MKHRHAFFSSDFPPIVSGISTYFYELLLRVADDNWIVVAPAVAGSEDIDKRIPCRVNRVAVPLGSSLLSKFFRFCVMTIKMCLLAFRGVEVFHCGQVLQQGVPALILKKVLGKKYTIFLMGGDGEKLRAYKWINELITAVLNRADNVFPISNFTRDEFAPFMSNPERMTIIFPGVDPDRFKCLENVDRARFGLTDRDKVLLTVARLGKIKGQDRVIQVLPRVKEKVPGVKYLVAGTGPEEVRLKALVEEYHLEDTVVFAGCVSDDELPLLYNACDLFIMTSIQIPGEDVEGFGIVYLEANACGKPVIGSRTGGISDAVVDGVTGILVDPDNFEEIAETIVKLLADGYLRESMGRAGRDRVMQTFNWDRSATVWNQALY